MNSRSNPRWSTRLAFLPLALAVATGCTLPLDPASDDEPESIDASAGWSSGVVVQHIEDDAGSRTTIEAHFARVERGSSAAAQRLLTPDGGVTAASARLGCRIEAPLGATSGDSSLDVANELADTHVSLVDVGDVTIRIGSEEARLARRAFPDVAGTVSGVVYTSRGAEGSQFGSSDGGYDLLVSGSDTMNPFSVRAEGPRPLSDVEFPRGVVLVARSGPGSGPFSGPGSLGTGPTDGDRTSNLALAATGPLSVQWDAIAANSGGSAGQAAGDVVVVKLRVGAAPALICVFPDSQGGGTFHVDRLDDFRRTVAAAVGEGSLEERRIVVLGDESTELANRERTTEMHARSVPAELSVHRQRRATVATGDVGDLAVTFDVARSYRIDVVTHVGASDVGVSDADADSDAD